MDLKIQLRNTYRYINNLEMAKKTTVHLILKEGFLFPDILSVVQFKARVTLLNIWIFVYYSNVYVPELHFKPLKHNKGHFPMYVLWIHSLGWYFNVKIHFILEQVHRMLTYYPCLFKFNRMYNMTKREHGKT